MIKIRRNLLQPLFWWLSLQEHCCQSWKCGWEHCCLRKCQFEKPRWCATLQTLLLSLFLHICTILSFVSWLLFSPSSLFLLTYNLTFYTLLASCMCKCVIVKPEQKNAAFPSQEDVNNSNPKIATRVHLEVDIL